VGDHYELRTVGIAAQQRQEAVEVEVVQRGLDLVEKVERTGPRQEHGEQEGQRRHRLLAARQERQALAGLAGGGDLDLDAEELLLLARLELGLGLGGGLDRIGVAGLGTAVLGGVRGQRLAAEHPSRRLLFAEEPQPPRAARETSRASSSKLRAAA